MSNLLSQMQGVVPGTATASTPMPVARRAISGSDYKVTTRLIQILGPPKGGKTVTAATLSKTWPKKVPATQMTVIKGMYYMQHDPGGIEAMWALNATPEWIFDMSDVTDVSDLMERHRAAASDVKQLGGAVDFLVRDSISVMHQLIHNKHLRGAEEKTSSLAYGKMAMDHTALWQTLAPLGKTVIQLGHIKSGALFYDDKDGTMKKNRNLKLQMVGLPGSLEIESNLPSGISKLYIELASATFLQRRIPGANKDGTDRFSLLVNDGVKSPAGSRWAPYLKEPEYPCDLRAILDAVEARCPAVAMEKDEYSIDAAQLRDGAVSGLTAE